MSLGFARMRSCERYASVLHAGLVARIVPFVCLSYLAGAHTLAFAGQPEPASEFAVRWDPAEGGPRDAGEVAKAFRWRVKDESTYVVRYYRATTASDAYAGMQVVIRERRSRERTELTFKLRSDRPMVGLPDLDLWTCPLGGKAHPKDEIDVSFTGAADVRRIHSRSCTVELDGEGSEIVSKLNARPLPCTSRMRRLRADDYKVEEWSLPNGTRLIEVSRNGRDRQDEMAQFGRAIVEPLHRLGARPAARSKTAGSECS